MEFFGERRVRDELRTGVRYPEGITKRIFQGSVEPGSREHYGIDFETTDVPFFDRKGKNKLKAGGHPRFARVLLSTGSNIREAWVHDSAEALPSPLDTFIFHNLSFDGLVGIQNAWWTLDALWEKMPNCTALMSKVLRNDRPVSLKYLAVSKLGEFKITNYNEVDKTKHADFIEYAKNDAIYTAKLFPIFEDELNQSLQWDLYRKVELPFALLNTECELNGMLVDSERLASVLSETKNKISVIEKGITSEKINFNSPKQIKRFLFGDLNLPLTYLRGKISTSKTSIKSLNHPAAEMLLKRQEAVGLKKQLDSIARFTDVLTNRIHPYINTLGADTGRCTSSNPNLQNISKDSVVRSLFVATPGYKMIVLDFGQIEPRVLAHFLGEGPFRDLFDSGQDFYEHLANSVFTSLGTNVPARAIAKQAILGVMYGLESRTMAANLGCTVAEAEAFLKSFHDHFPEISIFKKAALDRMRLNGYAEGLFNRRRFIDGLDSENEYERAQAEREAFNALIQGSAATIFKYKLVKLREQLPKCVRFLLHVHDEVIMEAPEEMADEILKVSKQLLEEPLAWFSVPLKVGGGVGSNWSQAKNA